MQIKYEHLLGHEFVHGSRDCYDILCRLYKDNLGIELRNYARPNDWWIQEGMDLYKDNFEKEGFQIIEDFKLSEVRPFDVFLIALPDLRDRAVTRTNHCAIYVGDGKVLHHRLGKLSETTYYRGALKNFTTCVIRHKDVLDYTQDNIKELNLMDYILPHKRLELEQVLNDKGL